MKLGTETGGWDGPGRPTFPFNKSMAIQEAIQENRQQILANPGANFGQVKLGTESGGLGRSQPPDLPF